MSRKNKCVILVNKKSNFQFLEFYLISYLSFVSFILIFVKNYIIYIYIYIFLNKHENLTNFDKYNFKI